MNEEKQPGIIFENILLKKINFERISPNLEKPEVDFAFSSEISISKDKKNMAYELTCDVTETKKQFFITCKMIGIFSCDEKEKNMNLAEFAENNAPALIFPFLREVIASVTVQSGMPSLLMPPMNIKAMIKTEKK